MIKLVSDAFGSPRLRQKLGRDPPDSYNRSPPEPTTAMNLVDECDFIRRREKVQVYLLCELAGVNHSTYSGWRHHRYTPRLDLFVACVNALGYEVKLVKNGE